MTKRNNSKKKPIVLWVMISRGIFVHFDKPKTTKVYGHGGDLFYCCLVVWFLFSVLLGFIYLCIYLFVCLFIAGFFQHSTVEMIISE